MARKEPTSQRKEIQDVVQGKRAIIGTQRTIKALRTGKLSKVFFTKNCPDSVKQTVSYYCKITNVNCEELAFPGSELGTICKKPFAISVLSIKNE